MSTHGEHKEDPWKEQMMIAVLFQCEVLISLQMSRHECQMETLL
jgi:hypothetical protein